MSESVVDVHNLTKRYGSVRAVENVSISIGRGEIYALLGLNGAGKTTTFRMLLGMVEPTHGVVNLFGRPLDRSSFPCWNDVGYLVEGPTAYPELTVRENLRHFALLRHVRASNAVDEAIDQTGLTQYAGRRASELSLGNRQRLGLAKAFMHRPQLLVLDEPSNGLDPAGVVEVRHHLQDLSAQGTTVLLSSHILGEVHRLATRIGVIHQGRMIVELATDDLPHSVRRHLAVTTRSGHTAAQTLRSAGYDATIGFDGIITVADHRAIERPEEISSLLVNSDQPPTSLYIEEEDLEGFFLRLIQEGQKQ